MLLLLKNAMTSKKKLESFTANNARNLLLHIHQERGNTQNIPSIF